MTRMPAEQCLSFGQRWQMICLHHALHCDRAQIGDLKIIARFQLLHRGLVETESEPRRRIGEPEKYNFTNRTEGARLARGEQRVTRFPGLERHQFAADRVTCSLRVIAKSLERVAITAAHYGAVEPAGDVAKRRARAEIRTRRHDQERGDLSGITRPPHVVVADRSRHTAPGAAIADQVRPVSRRTPSTSRPRRVRHAAAGYGRD